MKATVEIDSPASRPKPWRQPATQRVATWTHHRQLWRVLCLAVLLWPFFTQAHTSEEILSVTVTNYTGYVIDSDGNFPSAVYNRDAIRTSSQVRFSTAESTVSTYEYQMQYRLVDSQSNAVLLVVGVGQTNTVYNVLDNVTLPAAGGLITTVTRTYGAALRPAIRLNPYEMYHVELKLLERPGGSNVRYIPTGDLTNSQPKNYYHFTNTVSGDASLNVIAMLENSFFTRVYAVQSIPGNKSFAASVGYRLRRYDDFYAQPASANVAVHFNCELIDAATGVSIPLANADQTALHSMASFALGTPYQPAVGVFLDSVQLEPVAGTQLDPVNKTYLARITISHVNQAGQPLVAGNTTNSAPQRLLHFNGSLYFGPVQTTFTSIDNVPDIGVVTPNLHVATHLGVNNNSGYINGHPSHTYGDGTDLNVRLLPNGNAVLASGVVNVNEPTPDQDTLAAVRFERQNVTLDASGAHGTVIVTLPTGFGYRGNTSGRRLNSKLTWDGVALNQALVPQSDLIYNSPLFASEETKPFWVGASALRWRVTTGAFQLTPTSIQYVRRDELNDLEAASGLFEPDMKLKRSNEQYLRFAQEISSSVVTVQANANGHAMMSINVRLSEGQFVTHFPYDAQVKWLANGEIKFVADQVVPTNSYLAAVQTVTNSYNQDCPGCGPGKGLAALEFVPQDNQLKFTVDGGLEAPGSLMAPKALNWGWIAAPAIQKYAQRTTAFSAGNFLMAGCFLRGDQSTLGSSDRAGVILLTGADPKDLTHLERPGAPEYLNGFADYAGLNFRVGNDGAKQGESVLAGVASGLYNLTGRSKYYARASGISGIHEAVPGSFPATLILYGYNFSFDNYGLSYLSSQNKDSRTEGHVHLPAPSNFDQNFAELRFSCVGALESAQVPAGEAGLYKLLEYWNGDFITLGIKFDRDDSFACDPSVGYLVLGVQGHATHVQEPLFGALGFKPNGNLITAKDVISGNIKLEPGFNSRLKLPNNFKLRGPGAEIYTLNPVTDAYYNNWEDKDSAAQGYVNLAADLDVPFFKNIKAHLHTSGKTNSAFAPVYMMGGWPNTGFGSAADNFFTNPDFDESNRGYPKADGLATYRNSPTEKYHPRAQTSWLGVIDLDYPLDWSSTVRWFKSWQPVGADILVMSLQHQVKYLSAENAELVFATDVSVGGNLSPGIVFQQIDGQFGVLEAFQEAGLSDVQSTIKLGFNGMDTLLALDPHRFWDMARSHADLMNHAFCQSVADNPAIFDFQIDEYFDPDNGTMIQTLRAMDVEDNGLIEQIGDRLDNAIEAIESLRAIIAQPDGSNRVTASVLLGEVLRKGDAKFAQFIIDKFGGKVDGLFDKYLDHYDSSFNQIDAELLGIKQEVSKLRAKLNVGGEFYNEIHELFLQHDADLKAVVAKIRQDVTAYLNGFETEDLYDLDVNEMYLSVKQKLDDRFVASPLAPAVQVVMKQRLYDMDAAVREAADTEFALFDASLRTAMDELLVLLDKLFNKMLGKLQSVGGAAEVRGYAHINGDSLKLLRLDAAVQLRIPDAMEFSGYFQIKELDSDGTPTECLPASGRATEVTMGAKDIPVNYSGSTNGLKLTVGTKFTFDPGPEDAPFLVPQLVTLGGMFELNGSMTFGTLEVKYLSAGVAFGELENYITASATVKMNGYEGTGGVFLGKTCTLGFLYWDRDVTALLGEQLPFTGVYFYGEVWVPLAQTIFGVPSTCMFDISAGAGAGFGAFAEGPTFVAKMLFGLSGQISCMLDIKGTVVLAGKANPDGFALSGRGTLQVKVGPCPVCVDPSIDLFMTYQNSSWDLKF